MRLVLDVLCDGPAAGFGILEERRAAGTRLPDRIAILIPGTPAFGVQLPATHLCRTKAAMLLKVLDLGHRNALVISLHLTTLRAGVHHYRFAIDLDRLCMDDR